MNALITLLKASMFENMTLFKIKSEKKMKISEKLLPLGLTLMCFLLNGLMAQFIIEPLYENNLEHVLLTLFIIYTSAMTLIEGIYKSGSLLFNCKDDNLLLSLPIKKTIILLVRILKFYVFELLYNSLFLIPAMIVYAIHVNPSFTYYIVSIVALIVLPIIPVLLSCIIGGAISVYSSRFKFKSFAEIVVTTASLLAVLYVSMNFETVLGDIVRSAERINERIVSLYYPAGEYIRLILDFNITHLFIYILINVGLLVTIVYIFSKIYFNINSRIKVIKTSSKRKEYRVRTLKPLQSLIVKELNRFVKSPVYVTNSGFGLVLFIIGCVMIGMKYESVAGILITENIKISIEQIQSYMSVILFGFISFTALMTSITSSMISLEGKAFNILKSFPVKPIKVIWAKILTAMIIMLPFLLVGNIIIIIKFRFSIFETIVVLASCIVLSLVAETIGIIVNLKYPRMNAENDTQVVKQSISTMISVFTGMIFSAITIFTLYKCIIYNVSPWSIILGGLGVYVIIALLLLIYLYKYSIKDFLELNA